MRKGDLVRAKEDICCDDGTVIPKGTEGVVTCLCFGGGLSGLDDYMYVLFGNGITVDFSNPYTYEDCGLEQIEKTTK